MSDTTEDRYTAMAGPALAAELTERELPISGRVDELRERLRAHDAEKAAQPAAEDPNVDPAGDDPTEDEVEVPEPREPVEYAAGTLTLTEAQARQLTWGEAKLRAFTKHVNPLTERKYVEGDQVVAILVPDAGKALVLPFGIEVDEDSDDECGED